MSKLLRTDLPDDVWDRLAAEAAQHGVKIGVYIKQLVIARDRKKHGASTSTAPSNRKDQP